MAKKTKEKKQKEPEQKEQPKNEKQEIQVIERLIENKELTGPEILKQLSRSQIELLKRTVADGATDDEVALFLQICGSSNLNPFLHQVHFVPFWDTKAGANRRVVIVGIDGRRAIAESSGKYAGSDEAVFEGENEIDIKVKHKDPQTKKETWENKKLVVPKKATQSVYKIVDGVRCPFTATARWDEYYPKKENNRYKWHDMPYLMLGKCAEALALRKAFPKLLSGFYSPEEMDKAKSEAELMPSDMEKMKYEKGLASAIKLLEKQGVEEITTMIDKIQGSPNYTDDQKKQFIKAVDVRLKQLAKQRGAIEGKIVVDADGAPIKKVETV